MPLLGLRGLTDPCPMVLVLPEMCQPPAAPCQRAFQSACTPGLEVLVRSIPLVCNREETEINKRSAQNDLFIVLDPRWAPLNDS